MRGIHRWPVNSPHKGPVTWKMFPFHDVIMNILISISVIIHHPFRWWEYLAHILCMNYDLFIDQFIAVMHLLWSVARVPLATRGSYVCICVVANIAPVLQCGPWNMPSVLLCIGKINSSLWIYGIYLHMSLWVASFSVWCPVDCPKVS